MVVSYLKDKEWLKWCLKSIDKFCSGFKRVVIVVPSNELNGFIGIYDNKNIEMVFKTYYRVSDPRLWHLHHQAIKCRADEVCNDASMVLHTDSDCIFVEPVTPDDYIIDGKPLMLVEEYRTLSPDIPWKKTVADALKVMPRYETMRQHPAVHYAGLYPCARSIIERIHKIPFDDFVLSRKADFPWGFSEFNVLGNVALMPEWRNKYHVVDIGKVKRPKEKLMQFWSIGGLEHEQSAPHGEKVTPIQMIKRILE